MNAELYPHGVEVMVEGPSEIRLTDVSPHRLVIGPQALEGGQLLRLGRGRSSQAGLPLSQRVFGALRHDACFRWSIGRVGWANTHERAAELGTIESDDVCLATESLEEDNAGLPKDCWRSPPTPGSI